MAIVKQDGTNAAGANSYGTLVEASAYHADRGNTDWAEGDDAARNSALLYGREFQDASYNWIGQPVTTTQLTAWPRKAYDCDDDVLRDRHGNEIAEDEIPRAVIHAQFEIALIQKRVRGSLVGGANGSAQANAGPLKRVKAGSVEVEWSDRATGAPTPASNVLPEGQAEYADRLLAGLFYANRVSVRLGKA